MTVLTAIAQPCRGGSRPDMDSTPLVRHILRDEAITRGLGDIEARMIVEWLVEKAEQIVLWAVSDAQAWNEIRSYCRRARTIGCFLRLWSNPESQGAAIQLAATEKFHWPLPTSEEDLGEIMERVLAWNDRQDEMIANSTVRQAA